MNRTPVLLLALTLAVGALAGCTKTSTPTPTTSTSTTSTTTTTTTTTTPTPPTGPANATDYALAAAGVPASVYAGQDFTFTLFANGTGATATDHVGAHYGANSTNGTNATPSTTIYDKACAHQAGTLPGQFNVTCNVGTPGAYYLRGHARANGTDGQLNFWTSESRILVVGNLTLGSSLQTDATTPNTAHLNQAFTFTLYANGTGNVTSDHVGAHYSGASHAAAAPTTTLYEQACAHQAGAVPGVFTVSCTFTDPTTLVWYLRGHVRLTDAAGKTYDFWTQEYTITVSPI